MITDRFTLISGPPGAGMAEESSDWRRPRVTVVFTTLGGTLAALQAATRFARNLNAEIVLLLAEEVYFRYPLDHPPVSPHFLEQLCLALIDELPVDPDRTRIDIRYCRDRAQCLRFALPPGSLVVLGSARRWPLRERRLQRTLTQAGHEAILIQSDVSRREQDSMACRLLTNLTARVLQ